MFSEGLSRSQIALYLAAAAVIALLGARYVHGRPAQAGGAPASGASPAPVRIESPRPPSSAVVHVAGAVRRPGVYRLRAGERIEDAVRRAGGATRRADLTAVNLAAKVEDGRQVLVPERAPPAAAAAPGVSAETPAGGATPATGGPPAAPVNLNTATLEQLDTLPGVGPATAQKILAYRQEHGGFGSVDELGEVPGIGDKRLADLKQAVTL